MKFNIFKREQEKPTTSDKNKQEKRTDIEKSEGLGEMCQKYDDGSTRLTLEGFLNVLEGWEEQKRRGEEVDSFDDWTEHVDGLPETIRSLIGEGYLDDDSFDADGLIEKLYNENLILERLYYDFQNHQNPGKIQ